MIRSRVPSILSFVALVAVIAGVAWAFNRDADEPTRSQGDEAATPPEGVASCPSVSPMELIDPGRHYAMVIGPVTMQFARVMVGPDKEIFASYRSGMTAKQYRDEGLYQKIPLLIDAPAGTTFVVRGFQLETGGAMRWDGVNRLQGEPLPRAEWTFVPGNMNFPGPGCYQVFIEVEGLEYGPFGFEVRSSQPGEIVIGS